ncbi:MAG TPA: penicillin acylase family protein, partial [Solimonas sp.]|nr:penicillin acylase family protein [Solimonas sp.]
GKMDIMGASLYGVPLVLIGFNDKLAWSHTVSTAYRFTLYQNPVNPLNPMQYYYDGKAVDVTPVPLTIEVKQSDGSVADQSRTLYRTQYGPVLEMTVSGLPVLGWDNVRIYSMRDANAENDRLMNQFFAWNTAPNLSEFEADHAAVLGVPWVNTVATGPGQKVYYGDLSVVPNVPDSLVNSCKAPLLSPIIGAVAPGLPLLQGNRADCQWLNDSDAPAGIFGASHLPKLERSDWVANMNDSYWLTNPAEPLTGYARIIGDEGTERTLRTRLGIRQIQQRLDGSDTARDPTLTGTRFSYDDLKKIVLSSRIYSGELAKDAVLSDVCGDGTADACAALQNWNETANLDATGAHVWIEFWKNVAGVSGLWKTPFSIDDPVNTPNTLDTSKRGVAQALTDAQTAIREHGIAFDAPFGDVQHSGVHGDNGPSIFGSEGGIGAFTVADSDGLTDAGYKVNFGNSYIQAVTWNDGKVHAEGFITYSESTDPANPHYKDFTERYSQKQWLHFPFSASDVSSDAVSTVHLSE